jgi:hypothetical protein
MCISIVHCFNYAISTSEFLCVMEVQGAVELCNSGSSLDLNMDVVLTL